MTTMSENDYYQAFKEYGFEIKPLPSNYDPDTYARDLMSSTGEQDVSYASSTDYVEAN